ncbi:DUF4442 domain-containing protein [Flavihumibacter fluvii]|uniref:DUF4442 domain-containing protein n=1 Tax=Flavihumibacter fluvii TaxID=2838157 RepID=UPI001BDEB106|nr:DUF4442 domain-containing protein [Flavihumibacter fluvii]ULQ52850.1 DUF4442 domain-containing protein [Flavihumibacter fluvii]
MTTGAKEFISLVKHPVKFRLFLLTKLPSAYFSGVRVKSISESSCEVVVPYKWFSKNPFRSTYFACLSMAAEMSTGVLAMANTYKRKPAVSMLVTAVSSSYFKKASGITIFTCEDGPAIAATIEKAVTSGEGQTIIAKSVGRNSQGEVVAEFLITWSFKSKKS